MLPFLGRLTLNEQSETGTPSEKRKREDENWSIYGTNGDIDANDNNISKFFHGTQVIDYAVQALTDGMTYVLPNGEMLANLNNETSLTTILEAKYESVAKCGTFNCSKEIDLNDYPALQTIMNLFPKTANKTVVRIRYPNGDDTFFTYNTKAIEKDRKDRLDELAESCKLAVAGLAPELLLAIPVTFLQAGEGANFRRSHLYVFEEGWKSLNLWQQDKATKGMSEQRLRNAGNVIIEQINKLSTQGFILLDSKPDNTVVKYADGNFQCRFIDFDWGYMARVQDPDRNTVECIFLINAVLLLSAAIGIKSVFPQHLRHLYAPLLDKISDISDDRRDRREAISDKIDDGMITLDKSDAGLFCRVLDRAGPLSTHVVEKLKKNWHVGGTGLESKTDLDMYWWETITSFETSVAWQVLYLLQHYGRFVDIREYDADTKQRSYLKDWEYDAAKLSMFKKVADEYHEIVQNATFLDAVVATIEKIQGGDSFLSYIEPKLVADEHGGIDSVDSADF